MSDKKEYIERDEAVQKAISACIKVIGHGISQVDAVDIAEVIDTIPAADVIDKTQYLHVLKLAKKMHTWIFLNTGDEQVAYDEIGLTDKDNELLGYGGKLELTINAETDGK